MSRAKRQKNLIFSRRTHSRSALARAPLISARLPKWTLRPSFTASTPSARLKWLLPVPGGPIRCKASARSMNCNSASAMMRFLSSEGWNEKSKPARVLMAESRAMTRAIFTRRFSRKVSSSASSASIASRAFISPRSIRRTVASRISMGRGIFKPTRLRLMRSTTEGMISACAVIASSPGRRGGGRRPHRSRGIEFLGGATKDKAQPSCPRSKTGELHRIVDSVRLNLREAEGPSTEMPQARRVKIDWTSAAKDALLWVPAGWTWPPGETLRARLAMCGALGRGSVNSGAANQRSPNDVDLFHKIAEHEERRTQEGERQIDDDIPAQGPVYGGHRQETAAVC